MKQSKKTLKAFVLSMAMAVLLLLPLTMTAQYDESRYGLQPWFGSSMMGKENGGGNRDEGVGLGGAENENPTPVGSGIAILTAIGAGYALLKRKENKQ